MRVLVVEDEPKIAGFISQGLREEHYAVDVATDGEEALEWINLVPFDLIVLDVMIPKRDGMSVCRELRQRGIRTPVLMLTARDTVDDRVIGLDSGADDYLVKPFAFRELLARLRALIRRPPMTHDSTLRFADLALDTQTHTAYRGEQSIELTAKEYSILELLMRRPGHVLSRTTIAEHAWNYEFWSESNVVDVYIRNLRRKLDDGWSTKLIHTVRGVGYKLAEVPDEAA